VPSVASGGAYRKGRVASRPHARRLRRFRPRATERVTLRVPDAPQWAGSSLDPPSPLLCMSVYDVWPPPGAAWAPQVKTTHQDAERGTH
jgi:hypothetical protein